MNPKSIRLDWKKTLTYSEPDNVNDNNFNDYDNDDYDDTEQLLKFNSDVVDCWRDHEFISHQKRDSDGYTQDD